MPEQESEVPAASDTDGGTGQEEENNNDSKGSHGRVRARRKKIYKTLTSQMEFYFSDANLSKSKFMAGILEKEGPWISIELFLSFNKIKSLLLDFFHTEDHEAQLSHLCSALSKIKSSSLEISSDGLKVRRQNPFKGPQPDEEARTLYVENLPVGSSQESLHALFSEYGPVDYVSFPKYKESNLPKGFAFVEFSNVESAQKALEAYGFSSEEFEAKNPEELQSIKSFQIEQRTNLLKEENEESPVKEKTEEEQGTSDAKNTESPSNKSCKKKRKRKRKENMESEEDLQLMTLSVMSKTAWRRLRNKYLNLQRKNASLAKQRFKELKKAAQPEEAVEETKMEEEKQQEEDKKKKKCIPFVPNIIVKCVVENMVDDSKVYKKRIRDALSRPVQYIDVGIGNKEFHIRCADEDQANQLVQLKDGLFSEENNVVSLTILSGADEVEYWSKIQKDRDDKLTGKIKTRPLKRGREKLQEKIDNNVNTRIVFSDD